jgi:L-asparaginase / beta-aspartyl-peptidase
VQVKRYNFVIAFFCTLLLIMKLLYTLFLLIVTTLSYAQNKYALVIHGGAGTILPDPANPQKQLKYERAIDTALQLGNAILAKGGTAMDAIEASIRYMEDNPLFNAGKGAVFTNAGVNELDASIMNGKTLAAGSIAGVTTIKNPITTARAVMEKSKHVMLTGKGAEIFAKEQGHLLVPNKYFYTKERWEGLQRAKKRDQLELDSLKKISYQAYDTSKGYTVGKYGTVGAVALDVFGNIAAGTSTGGMTNKKYGRVGDAPIIGAGTYANNATCGISCTGWGEYFIRLVMAKSVSDLMEYKNLTIDAAAAEMIQNKLPALGGDGGLVGLDKDGNITMQFNSAGMYRGYIKSNGDKFIGVFK